MKNFKLVTVLCTALGAAGCGSLQKTPASSVQSARSAVGSYKVARCGNDETGVQINVAADIKANSATLSGFGGKGSSKSVDYKLAGDVDETNLTVSIVAAGSYTERFNYSLSTSTNYVESSESSSELSRVELSFVKSGGAYVGSVDLVYRSGYMADFAHFDNCVFSNVDELLFKVAR